MMTVFYKEALDFFARSWYHALIEFNGFLSACSAQAEAQCFEKAKTN
jgi:hypothetical protein